MNRSTLTKLGFLFILAISFTACDKYEEGANFSLLTAKMRAVNHWKLTKVTATNGSNTSDQTPSGSLILKLKKDETYESIYTWSNFTTTENGNWEFNSDKTNLISTDDNGDIITYEIIKLKNKELKLEYVDGNTTYLYEYSEDE